MNKQPDTQETTMPGANAWSELLRRSRRSDRAIARALFRHPEIRRSGGVWKDMALLADAELAAELHLSPRQIQRLRCADSALWRYNGNDLLLGFVAKEHPQGLSTAAIRERLKKGLSATSFPYSHHGEETENNLLAAEADSNA